MSYTLTIVRGEQPNATGEELSLGHPLNTPATLHLLSGAGYDEDDTDVWVLVNDAGEDTGELRNVINSVTVRSTRELAQSAVQGDDAARDELLQRDTELLARYVAFRRQADADQETRMGRGDWFDTMLDSTPEADELYAAYSARLDEIAASE